MTNLIFAAFRNDVKISVYQNVPAKVALKFILIANSIQFKFIHGKHTCVFDLKASQNSGAMLSRVPAQTPLVNWCFHLNLPYIYSSFSVTVCQLLILIVTTCVQLYFSPFATNGICEYYRGAEKAINTRCSKKVDRRVTAR